MIYKYVGVHKISDTRVIDPAHVQIDGPAADLGQKHFECIRKLNPNYLMAFFQRDSREQGNKIGEAFITRPKGIALK